MLSTASLAIFPEPYGYGGNFLRQGWYDNQPAWHLQLHSSNDVIFLLQFSGAALAPKLSSLLHHKVPGGEIAARPMYVVLNPPATQGFVFSSAPGQDPPDPLYSGFWQVFYVTWKPGSVRRPIVNAIPGDPQGLPSAAEADIIPTSIVAQFPIVAIGPLGGPWLPAAPGSYRIKQGFAMPDYARSKLLFLPAYQIHCRDFIGRRVRDAIVVIPDATDQVLADEIGANYAPGLNSVPDGTVNPSDNDTQAVYWVPTMAWPCQLLILEQCPFGFGVRQKNADFTPVGRFIVLERNTIPQWTIVNNIEYVEFLLSTGDLTLVDDHDRLGMLVFAGG